jgi:pimeloyl-ACP methyl ester carboxylesterase
VDWPESSGPSWFRSALNAAVEVDVLELEGCRIVFRRWGDRSKPGLVLVHGGGAHSRWWDHVGPLLTGDYCVAALDLSGHGDSGRRPRYGFEVWGQEVLAVASAVSHSGEPPVLVGHSMGGSVSVCAAARAGAHVGGLIMVDSSLGAHLRRPGVGVISARTTAPRVYSSREEALSRFRLRPAQPEALPYVLDHIARTSVARTAEGWTWKVDPRSREREDVPDLETLLKVECRLSFLRGEFGRVSPDAGALLNSARRRRTAVIEIPRAHHHVMVDEPLSLVTGLRSVLSEWAE